MDHLPPIPKKRPKWSMVGPPPPIPKKRPKRALVGPPPPILKMTSKPKLPPRPKTKVKSELLKAVKKELKGQQVKTDPEQPKKGST